MGISLEGAETATFFAPAFRCNSAFSIVVNIPVHSATTSVSNLPQLMLEGSFSDVTLMLLPLTTKLFPSTSTVPFNLPCTESYFNKYAR